VPTVATTYYRPGLVVPGAAVTYSSGYAGYVPTTSVVATAPAYGYSVVAPSVYVAPRRLFRPWRPYGVYLGW
jgi:hypothetical protein